MISGKYIGNKSMFFTPGQVYRVEIITAYGMLCVSVVDGAIESYSNLDELNKNWQIPAEDGGSTNVIRKSVDKNRPKKRNKNTPTKRKENYAVC